MYELDTSWSGFEWINADDNERSIFSFCRKSKDCKNNLLFVINFTPVERPDYRVGVLRRKAHKLILNSEDCKFNGPETDFQTVYKPEKIESDGKKYSIAYPLAPYGVAVFKF